MRKEGGGRPGQGNGPLSTRNNREEAPRLSAHLTLKTAARPVSRTSTRHWTRRNRAPGTTILTDAIAWLAFALITAAVLLALCMMLAILWPVTP
jgi:hypothetical protein